MEKMKVVCIKNIKKFKPDNIYKSEFDSGIIYAPYIIAESIPVKTGKFNPSKSIMSKYSKKISKNNYSTYEYSGSQTSQSYFKVFYNDNKHEIFNGDEYREHFISIKEYRKLKLDKINGNN